MNALRARWRLLDEALGTRAAGAALLLVLAVAYAWLYWQHPLNPGRTDPAARVGWWSWADQYKYLQSLQALADGRVAPDNYHYPLGYPALGVPFVRWLPGHPFLVPDLLLVLGAAYCWWHLARRWLTPSVALLVGGVFCVTHRALIELTMVVPWNTVATQGLLLAGLGLTLARRDVRGVAGLAALAGAAWWVRPIDALAFGPLLVGAVLRLPGWARRGAAAATGLAILGAAVVGMGLLNRGVFGTWRSPYEQAAFTMVGFFDYPLGMKLYWTFLDARPFFGETDTALLWRYPWLVLAVPGLVFLVAREGAAGCAVVGAIVLNWLLYLGYNDFFPSSFYRFSLIHYVAWSFLPLLAVAAGAVWAGWKLRSVQVSGAAALALLFVAAGLRLEERPLPGVAGPGVVEALPSVRPLWVHFAGEPLERVAGLRLDGRTMLEAADFQIPYVPSDLKLLLGDHARGTRLATAEGSLRATPTMGTYRWRWGWPARRPGN